MKKEESETILERISYSNLSPEDKEEIIRLVKQGNRKELALTLCRVFCISADIIWKIFKE